MWRIIYVQKYPLYKRFKEAQDWSGARARFVIVNNEPMRTPGRFVLEYKLFWIGIDDRGLELEITGIQFEDEIFIIHVMPTNFRKRGRDEY